MENGEMRMLSDELRVVRIWHSGLERVGRTAVMDGKGWTHSSYGWERVGRTAVMDGKGWTHSSYGWERVDAQQCVPTTSQFHNFTNYYLLMI
jgi:hypothetical protein